MRRLVVFLIIAAFLVALPATQVVAKKDKVDVCHVSVTNDDWPVGVGKVISVSENALKAHLGHGDSIGFIPLSKEWRDYFEKAYDVEFPKNADCWFKKKLKKLK